MLLSAHTLLIKMARTADEMRKMLSPPYKNESKRISVKTGGMGHKKRTGSGLEHQYGTKAVRLTNVRLRGVRAWGIMAK